jgi:hypothetical protein
MADKISVHIATVPGSDPGSLQTVSKFVLYPNAQVTFHNKATANAVVEFAEPSPVCKGGQSISSIPLIPGQEEKLKICVEAGEFKYTATVDGAVAEDPIFIVERSSVQPGTDKKPIFFPEGIPMLVIGGLLGALIGYLVARRLLTRSR